MKKVISFKSNIKGNLHAHTTRTDGQFTVDEIGKLYKENGYAFIAITDHIIYYRKNLNYDEMFILNGCEYNCYLENDELGKTVYFHILALEDLTLDNESPIDHDDNSYNKLFYNSLSQVQELINELRNRGNIIIIAHPKNQKIPFNLLMKLEGYHGVEVYNAKAKSDASDYVYEFLLNDKDIFFTAVDDSHKYLDENGQIQYFSGFIVIEDMVINKLSIIEAIKEKRFYASNGPSIEEIVIEDDKIFIKCSDVKEIALFMYGENVREIVIKTSNKLPINEAEFSIPKDINYITLECMREDGKKAWTNKMFINI